MHLSRFIVRALVVVVLMALIGMSWRANSPGIDVANFDSTCKACDDFYAFATGGWQKAHPIPVGYSAWSSSNI